MRLIQLLCRKDKNQDKDPTKDNGKTPVIPSKDSDLNFTHILNKVTSRVKVKRAAILDHHGNISHVTPNWNLLPDDGHTLMKILKAVPTLSLWKVFIFGEDFLCFNCDSRQTILGHSKTTVMAAHVTRKYIVVGLAAENDSGSCLYEMRQVWEEIESHGS